MAPIAYPCAPSVTSTYSETNTACLYAISASDYLMAGAGILQNNLQPIESVSLATLREHSPRVSGTSSVQTVERVSRSFLTPNTREHRFRTLTPLQETPLRTPPSTVTSSSILYGRDPYPWCLDDSQAVPNLHRPITGAIHDPPVLRPPQESPVHANGSPSFLPLFSSARSHHLRRSVPLAVRHEKHVAGEDSACLWALLNMGRGLHQTYRRPGLSVAGRIGYVPLCRQF